LPLAVRKHKRKAVVIAVGNGWSNGNIGATRAVGSDKTNVGGNLHTVIAKTTGFLVIMIALAASMLMAITIGLADFIGTNN